MRHLAFIFIVFVSSSSIAFGGLKRTKPGLINFEMLKQCFEQTEFSKVQGKTPSLTLKARFIASVAKNTDLRFETNALVVQDGNDLYVL